MTSNRKNGGGREMTTYLEAVVGLLEAGSDRAEIQARVSGRRRCGRA